MINEEFSNELLREEWYNLSSDNYNSSFMSAVILETTITMADFIDSDNGPTGGGDVSPLWWHIGNAIRAAATAYIGNAMYEVAVGDPPAYTNEECKRAIIVGGVMGGLTAL